LAAFLAGFRVAAFRLVAFLAGRRALFLAAFLADFFVLFLAARARVARFLADFLAAFLADFFEAGRALFRGVTDAMEEELEPPEGIEGAGVWAGGVGAGAGGYSIGRGSIQPDPDQPISI
jgi:hypothetical protein